MLPAPSSAVVYLGPARSGKTYELVRRYREALQNCGPLSPREAFGSRSKPSTLGRTLWLAPNARAAALVRGELLADGLDACLEPGVMTFHDLAGLILAETNQRLRPLRPHTERELLRRVVTRALDNGALTFFAEAAGRTAFIDLLAEHFHELQRADISSDVYAQAVSPRGDEEQQRELAQLYREYERQLETHALINEDSAHRKARDALAAGAPTRFQYLELIVADGFTDFTRTQHDILRLLAQHAKQLLISLPSDPHEVNTQRTGCSSDQSTRAANEDATSLRADLFAKTASTLDELKHYHPRLESRELAPRPLAWPALDHVVRHVFRNPACVPSPSAQAIGSLNQLEIVAAASTHDEIVQIARRIKQRLTELPLPNREGPGEGSTTRCPSTRPSDIVVVFRTLTDVAPRVREVFDEFGIPYFIEANQRIAAAPVVRSLLSLLRLDDENWPFRRVVSVITNNSLDAFDAAARQAADWLVRELQIADGRDKLLDRIEQLAAIETPLDQLSEHVASRVTAARAALPLLRLLAQSFDNLPEEATPTEWSAALAHFGAQLGLVPLTEFTPQSKVRDIAESNAHATDRAAWHCITNSFAALERLDAWLNVPARNLSRRELLAALVDVASHESLPHRHDDVGRVRILAAPSGRAIHAKHLYLAGMSEQAFPMPERAGRLATDADYRFLARAADRGLAHFAAGTIAAMVAEQNVPVPLCAKSEQSSKPPTRAQDEMLLFYEVLSRPEESLTISYPALDDKAQDLPPSPYVQEIERTFGESNRDALRPKAPQLSPVPRDATPFSDADWRVVAVARAIDKTPDRRLLAGIFSSASSRPLGHAIDAGLRIVHARAHGDSFGPAEGLLTSPAVAARLAQKFGTKHYWSPSQWETYAACPYKFFLEDVLNLTPLGDLVLETDYTRRGSRLHHVLATFHRQWTEFRSTRAMTADEERSQFLEHLLKVTDEQIAAPSDGGIDAALLELDRRQIRKWAEKHFDHHVKFGGTCSERGALMTPTHLEFRFGPSRPGDAENDPQSTRQAFELDIEGEKIRVIGQIDRIDVGALDGQTVFSVIDYKSGKKPSLRDDDIQSGERLQLPIYVEAAQALVFGGNATPLVAGYWSMTGGFDAKGALAVEVEGDNAERWKKMRRAIEERIGQFVNDIRHGAFPVASRDDKCTSYCEFNTVCRVAQIRSLGKTVNKPL
ncbi:MAG: exodeoxyribonuclease V subunit gamma [Planctomycetes bacterium]|nr:exodeoxyribonuclease V subunit gamma [Planctomycetota bacterium]